MATITSQILAAVAGLRDTVKINAQAAAVMLTSVLKEQRNNIKEKVPEIVDIIYFHLQATQEDSARQAAMGAVCLLAEKHTQEVVSALLRVSLPCDSHVSQLWEALGRAKKPVSLRVLAELLAMLKRRPCLETSETSGLSSSFEDASILPLATSRALCIIFSNKECLVPMGAFYVSVLIFLIIHLHYLLQKHMPVLLKPKKVSSPATPLWGDICCCTVEALKAVMKREKYSLMQSVSLAGAWDLLSMPETYLEGVLLLARAILKHHRSLDFAVFTKVAPLLHHGDDKQKLTAMALFTGLLSTESTYVTLKKQYILGHLKNWHVDPRPAVRWLALLGLGNVALHLQKERHKISCAAAKLLGDLLRALSGKHKSFMQEQVLNSMVPLLLNLQQQHPDVIKSCADTLQECKALLGWTLNDKSFFQAEWYPERLWSFLHQAQEYLRSPCASSRRAASIF
uniref:Maestro heat like repeat family member 6 n=1 Tax=Pelodiscus sinensis TaxID=13735 RepID=K7FRQ0_PELSI